MWQQVYKMKIFLFLLLHCRVVLTLNSIVKYLAYNETYNFVVNSSFDYNCVLHQNNNSIFPLRVTVTSPNANASAPLMILSRQTGRTMSWELPLVIESKFGIMIFNDNVRTLCYDEIRGKNQEHTVLISTASKDDVEFTIRVDDQEDFFLGSKPIQFVTSPNKPKYFCYNCINENSFPIDSENVIVDVQSNDSVCMTVTIQNFSCPVFDSREDVTFRGFHGTVSTKGHITIPKYKFPHGFFVMFVVNDNDQKCGVPSNTETNRTKNVTFSVNPKITYNDYLFAVSITLGGIGIFYLVFLLSFCYYLRTLMDLTTKFQTINSSNLAMQNPKDIKKKTSAYLYYMLIVAIFYGLPVIQLVATYQTVLNNTGQQDICYYNFLCAHPVGLLSDFNHVFSNIAYVLLGQLFMCITKARECMMHRDIENKQSYGIIQHYGMFHALGVALIVEGVLSGYYHVCPNNVNIQFDQSFMYVICILFMVSLYQNRHPDNNAQASKTFGLLAIIIVLVSVTIYVESVYPRVIIIILYILMCLYISFKIYYFEDSDFDFHVGRLFKKFWIKFQHIRVGLIKPQHKDRFILLLIGNLCNFAIAIFGATQLFSIDYGFFVLGILMLNTILYFGYYTIMKYIHKERVFVITWIFLTISITCACGAIYCFLQKHISWDISPAMSRGFNEECIFLQFYDFHDIWHFLSAIGVFFIFMTLLTLDDDLIYTLREKNAVF